MLKYIVEHYGILTYGRLYHSIFKYIVVDYSKFKYIIVSYGRYSCRLYYVQLYNGIV